MSEEENENKPKVCANFEPQAWKKNKCMNCFQPPEAHANISTENGGEHTGNTERSLSPSKKGAAATSLKDKYEQLELEKDKPKPLDSPHTLPRTKGKGGLSAITEMYNTLDMKSGKLPQSPSGNIPPPVFPKTFKKDGDSNLKMSQFGSVENVNSIGADSPVDFGMKNKLKFGSMENISSVFDKKKESVKIPVLKNKVEDSSQNAAPITASKPVAQTITTSIEIVNKQDSSQNEMKAGPTVINKQTNSKVDIFKLPPEDKKSEKKSLKLDIKTGNEMNKVDKSSNAIQTPLTKDSSSLKTLTSEISSTKNKSAIFTSLKSKDDLKSPVGNLEKDKKPLGNLKDQLKSPTPDKDKKPVFDLKDRLKSPTHNEDSKSETSPRKDKFPPVEKKTDIKPLKLDIKTDKERNKVDETSNSNQTPSTKESNTLRTLEGALSPTKNESDLVNSSNSKDNLKSPVANIEKDKNLTGNLRDKLKSPTPDKDKTPLLNLKDRLKSPPHNEDSKSDTLTWKDKLKSQSKDNKIESKSQLKSPTPDFEKKPTFAPKSKAETDKLAKEEQSGLANKDQLNQISQPKEDIKSPGGEQNTSRSFKLRDNLKTGNVDTDKQSAKQIGKSETDSKKGFSFKDSLKSNKKDDNSTEIQKETESLKSKTLGVNDKLLSTPTNKLTDLKDKLKPKEQTESNVTLPDIKDQSKLKSSSEAKTSKKNGEDKDLIKTNEDTSIIQSNKLTDLKDKLKSKNESESKFGNKLTDFKDKLRSKTETESKTDNSLTSFKDKLKSKDETETKPKTKLNDFKDNLKSKNDTDSSSTATDKLKSKDAPDSRTASKNNDVTDKVKSKEDSETVPKKTDLRDALKTKNDPQSKTSNKVFDFKDKFKSKQDGEQATIKVVDYRNAIKSKEKDKRKEAKQNDNKNSKDKSQSTSNALMLKSTKSGDDGKNDGHNNSNKINVSLTDQMGEETAGLKSNAINAENNDKKDDSNNLIPQKTDISPESKSDDKGNACALISPTPAEKSPLHVDTQVFTSSRSKTSGESNLVADGSVESASGSTKRQSDISIIDFRKDKSPVESKQSDKDKGAVIPNGDIRDSFRSMENSSGKKSSILCSESEIEKLKEELINMTERCQNLETENTLLSDSIKKKDTQETALQKQKNEVETSVKTLRQQLKCLEDKCQKLETDNVNLINDIQTRREVNHLNHNSEKESDESDEKMSAREKLMEDIIEENEQLKEEIKDLKVEMEEMYDSFRDQEAEEFRELQKELEFTAKNCRILQFKLRKTERRNEQNEKEKATYEERLRKLQNQFQDRDAVAHIHSLEDELRMAKDVSVRLHDEMDLLEERRGKVEEENRHLTELLEQADRKQFRLELEVDKLRDKVIELRQELRTREFGPEGEPRKVTLDHIRRQESMEHEINELKRSLFDCKERELDLRDQLKFMEADNRKMMKNLKDLDQENERLSSQMKKMTVEQAIRDASGKSKGDDSEKIKSAIDLRIQMELAEQELSNMKSNMAALDDENEKLHNALLILKQNLKEQEKQIKTLPLPSSPNAFYEDMIRELKENAIEYRSKIIDKDNELERVYAELHNYQHPTKRNRHDLRKSRSLDSDSDYNIIVDLRRQLEICQRELLDVKKQHHGNKTARNSPLRLILNEKNSPSSAPLITDCVKNEGVYNVHNDNAPFTSAEWLGGNSLRAEEENSPAQLTGLAVAFIETEDEVKLRQKVEMLEMSQRFHAQELQVLVNAITSLTHDRLPKLRSECISKLAKQFLSDEIIECFTLEPHAVEFPSKCQASEYSAVYPGGFRNSDERRADGNESTFIFSPGRNNNPLSVVSDDNKEQANLEFFPISRDPSNSISFIEKTVRLLLQWVCESEKRNCADDNEVDLVQRVDLIADNNDRGHSKTISIMDSVTLGDNEVNNENTSKLTCGVAHVGNKYGPDFVFAIKNNSKIISASQDAMNLDVDTGKNQSQPKRSNTMDRLNQNVVEPVVTSCVSVDGTGENSCRLTEESIHVDSENNYEKQSLELQSHSMVELGEFAGTSFTSKAQLTFDQCNVTSSPIMTLLPRVTDIAHLEPKNVDGDTGDFLMVKCDREDEMASKICDNNEAVVKLDKEREKDNTESLQLVSDLTVLQQKIEFLEEEIDDLRLIIRSKEEKNILLEEEVTELEAHAHRLKDEARKRELELLQEMDLIHGKNEILTNLLDIVKERAEAAEDELERVFTETNETRASSISSDKSAAPIVIHGDNISVGSDDVFDGSPADRSQLTAFWEEQFKKRIRSLETLLAEERNKVSYLESRLNLVGSDVISSAMSDDAKLQAREKELLQSELRDSQKHATFANDQIRSLTEKLKKAETDRRGSPKVHRRLAHEQGATTDEYSEVEPYCKTCAELQSVKNQLSDELISFKTKAEELEVMIDDVTQKNEMWVSKFNAAEQDKQLMEQKFGTKVQETKRLEDQLSKIREEDRMKDIFLKERDNNIKDKTNQIARKEELIQEQEDIIRQREEDMQELFDKISQRERTIKELKEAVAEREERIKEKDEQLHKLSSHLEEKTEELHFLEEEVQEAVLKRKESESTIAELELKIEETLKSEKNEIETENERLQSDVDNLMSNLSELHQDKQTLQNELDKAKQALSEAMLMWERDRSYLGTQLNITNEKLRLYESTAEKKDSHAIQTLRREVHAILETREKLVHELKLQKMEHDNTVRILKTEKFKLTEELTSKIRMLTHEMTNNDKMSDELVKLRGQDEINYQLHHSEKLLKAELLAMKVRYETQLDRLQKEHLQLLEVVERLQRETHFDKEIIVGVQKGMANIRDNYTQDLSRWKDERSVLESHITQIEEGKEIAQHLRAQIDALRRQLMDQDVERTDLVKKITSERRNWDVERAQLNSKINQLDEQLSVFIHAQSRSKDTQYRMEIAWEKERAEQKRLLTEAHQLAMDLQEQLQRRDEEHARERRNLLDQLESHQTELEDVKNNRQRMSLELRTEGTRVKHVERQMEDMREKHQQENDFWVKEKGDLLRRLAEMRKLHVRDVRRIDDVLAALKRLRELASIVVESDTSATLPSNGNDVSGTSGDASAASASVTSHEPNEISDLKENIDQVILKYVKESLRQIHFVAEELARPTADFSHEEKQKMRRSLSSSEIELLKDEFLLGPQGPGIPFSYHEAKPEVKLKDSGERRETPGVQRHVTHEGSHVTFPSNGIIPSDSLENNVMEQSSFYNDDRDTKVEVHRIKQTRDVTRVETKITTLPKPPPSFIIPRSRSTSPAPQSRTKLVNPVLKTMTLDTTSRSHRLYTPLTDVNSRSSSADSSPVGTSITPSFVSASNGSNGLYGAGPLESGSLDRLSPQTARRRFFESQPSSTSSTTVSWSERRKREANPNRNSRSSTELYASESVEHINGAKGHLRNSVSMDDGVINLAPEQEISATGNDVMPRVRSVENTSGSSKHHSGLRDIISAMKRKFKPKIKRSQSAREYDKGQRLNVVKETEFHETELAKGVNPALDDAHVTQEQLTPIKIPDNDENREKTSKKDKKSKSRSRSPSKSSTDADKEEASSGRSTLQRIKKRFRSRSADRGTRDHVEPHVRPILVGHSSATAEEDGSWRYSETGV